MILVFFLLLVRFLCLFMNLSNNMFSYLWVWLFVPEKRVAYLFFIETISESSLSCYLTVANLHSFTIWVWWLLNYFTAQVILLKAMKKWKLSFKALITYWWYYCLFVSDWLSRLVWLALEHWNWWLLLVVYRPEVLGDCSNQTIFFIVQLRIISFDWPI